MLVDNLFQRKLSDFFQQKQSKYMSYKWIKQSKALPRVHFGQSKCTLDKVKRRHSLNYGIIASNP